MYKIPYIPANRFFFFKIGNKKENSNELGHESFFKIGNKKENSDKPGHERSS
jgi:hypothetical protein